MERPQLGWILCRCPELLPCFHEIDTVCIRYGYPSDTSDKDNIKDKDKDNEKECGESADKPRRTRSQLPAPVQKLLRLEFVL